MWVFPWKRCELRERNRENPKHGNDDNSDTRRYKRKIGALLVQCNHQHTPTTAVPHTAESGNEDKTVTPHLSDGDIVTVILIVVMKRTNRIVM